MGQKDIAALFPVTVTGVEMATHHLAFVFQTLEQEPLETARNVELRHLVEPWSTRDGQWLGRVDKGFVVVPKGLGNKVA